MTLTSDKLPTGSSKIPKETPKRFTVHKDGKVEWSDEESNGLFAVPPEDVRKAWEALRR